MLEYRSEKNQQFIEIASVNRLQFAHSRKSVLICRKNPRKRVCDRIETQKSEKFGEILCKSVKFFGEQKKHNKTKFDLKSR